MKLSIPSPMENNPRTFAPRCRSHPTSPSWDNAISKIRRAVYRWEEMKPLTITPPIIGPYDRIGILVELTGHWPPDVVTEAEEEGFNLPAATQKNVTHTILGIRQCRAERNKGKNDWDRPELERRWNLMTEEEKARPTFAEEEIIVDPRVNEALGVRAYQMYHPNMRTWIDGEKRNQYVTAGFGILFRRTVNEIEVLLEPEPKLSAEGKKWTWKDLEKWRMEERAKIPKKKVTVICEYGSRRYAEGEPVVNQEGKIVRLRYAGEWRREMHAFLEGTPSPFFFDDYTGFPHPAHSYRAKQFRQAVADVAFVLQSQ